MSVWKPIDTAPKGVWVIGHHPNWEIPAVAVLWQMDYREGREVWTFGDGECPDEQPTHWIPVPDRP